MNLFDSCDKWSKADFVVHHALHFGPSLLGQTTRIVTHFRVLDDASGIVETGELLEKLLVEHQAVVVNRRAIVMPVTCVTAAVAATSQQGRG